MQTTFSRKNRSSRNCSVRDGDLEIAVRGGDDSHVDVHVVAAAQPRELAVLQHLQELRLQRLMHLADFVEEHRPFVRELELARLLLDGAGEGASLEPEQLRLEQLGREGRAVDLDEGAVPAGRRGVDGARDELLAGSALAADEHRHVGVGDASDEVVHFPHLLARAEQLAGDARRTAFRFGWGGRRIAVEG